MLHSAASFSRLLPEMVSPKELAAIVQSSLLGASGTSPTQRIELTHALRNSFSSFQNLLSFPVLDFGDPSRSFSIILRFRLSSHSIFVFSLFQPPKASDRAQVQSKEIRLPDSLPISLDEQDVAIVSVAAASQYTPIKSKVSLYKI